MIHDERRKALPARDLLLRLGPRGIRPPGPLPRSPDCILGTSPWPGTKHIIAIEEPPADAPGGEQLRLA
jgi:hypothetical protein